MKLFALVHDPAGDRVLEHDGMDQATVTALLNEKATPFEFIDEPAYTTFIAANLPVPMTPAARLAGERVGAVTQLATGTAPDAKLIRGILLLAMNEINLLREWIVAFKAATASATTFDDLKARVAGLSATPSRTAGQLKTAVQSIINAGTAD